MLEYKIGDKVKIREWDDMEEEFELDTWGDIRINNDYQFIFYTSPMKKYCGKEAIIIQKFPNGRYALDIDNGKYVYSVEMFESEKKFPSNLNEHLQLCNEIHELYKLKNTNYGNSFSELFEEFEMSYVVPRLVEKTNRIKTLTMNKDLDYDDESIRDSLLDLANYSIMTIIELDKKERLNHENC